MKSLILNYYRRHGPNMVIISVAATVILLTGGICGTAQAQAHYNPTPENKGIPTDFNIPSHIGGSFTLPDGRIIDFVIVNREEISLLPPDPIWNWVAKQADLALNDLDAPVDFFFFMVVEGTMGFEPLPTGMSVASASITGTSGTEYPAQITPISDLANLPTSSTHLSNIEWDLSGFAQTTGNFYLAKVTLPTSWELLPLRIPILSEWGVVLLIALLLVAGGTFWLRHRWAGLELDSEK